MPGWIGDGRSERAEDDPRLAKLVDDLKRLMETARAANASLDEVHADPPPWMPPDLRLRVAGLRHICERLSVRADQLAQTLATRRDKSS